MSNVSGPVTGPQIQLQPDEIAPGVHGADDVVGFNPGATVGATAYFTDQQGTEIGLMIVESIPISVGATVRHYQIG